MEDFQNCNIRKNTDNVSHGIILYKILYFFSLLSLLSSRTVFFTCRIFDDFSLFFVVKGLLEESPTNTTLIRNVRQ